MDKFLEGKVIITIFDQRDLTSDMVGAKVLYKQEKGLGIGLPWLEGQLEEAARRSLLSGAFTITRFINEKEPEQQVAVMLEPCLPPEKLVILGGGHVAKALTTMAKMIGFHVVVLDDRPDFATAQRLPEADQIIIESYEKAEEVIDFKQISYVVIVTRGHHHDWVSLRQAIKYPLSYLGVIGSTKKIEMMRRKLREENWGQSAIDSVYMPIGLDIGARTPEEIAISIAAELIKIRHGGSAASMSGNKNPGRAAEERNDQSNLIKKAVSMAREGISGAVATIIAAQGSTPRKAGSRMIIKEDGSIYGTIGGGQGEAIVCAEALKTMGSGTPSLIKINMDAETKDDSGMICGGNMQVFIETITSYSSAFAEES